MTIQITHYALNAPTGDHPRGLFCACQAGLPAFQANRDRTVPDPISGQPSPLMLAQLPGDGALFNPERLLPALDDFLVTHVGLLEDAQVLLCLPGTTQARHARLNQSLIPSLHQRIAHLLPGQATANALLITDAQALPALLVEQIDLLACHTLPALVLIGMDSLLNEETLFERQPDNDLRTTTWAHGRVLSEAMALIRFEPGTATTPGTITCAGVAAHPGDDAEAHHGLAQATRSACQQATPLPRPHRLILARAQQRDDELSWYRTHTALWPVRLSPRDNLAMRKGEKTAPQPVLPAPLHILRPALTTGDTGAAALPLALITACESLRFSPCPAETAMVLDSPGAGTHLAINLRHTLSAASQTPEQPTQPSQQHAPETARTPS